MSEPKGTLARTAALLVPTLTGLVASAMLLVDYVRPAAVFCAEDDGGCAFVRGTKLASILGVPTPVFGVAAFLALGLLALQRGPRARAAHAAIAAVGALGAIFFLTVQAAMGHWCRYCVVVDASLCLVLVAALLRLKGAWDPSEQLWPRVAGAGGLAAALLVPLGIGFTMKPPPPVAAVAEAVPDAIQAEMARTTDGRITVVDFADFECPFCRMSHEAIAPVLESNRSRIRLVRKQVPLTRIHPHALDAARAACCGEALGKGDAMADALFRAPVEDLTTEGCEKIAVSLGLQADAFRACVIDPKTGAQIDADIATFRAARGHGLPTLWIDGQKLEGRQSAETLQEALAGAGARKG
jgi:protein-disulfide isomerase/uncharacterized membrane protein